jgi:hypothetical protein
LNLSQWACSLAEQNEQAQRFSLLLVKASFGFFDDNIIKQINNL